MRANGHEQTNAAPDAVNTALDDGRLRKLVSDEAPRLYRVLMFLLRDREVATTIMRKSFLDAIRSGVPHREAGFPSQLYGAAVLRARGLLPRRKLQDSDHSRSVLLDAFAGLDADQRVCLALCDVGGMTANEASVVLNVDRDTCRRRLHDARTVLCKRLYPQTKSDSPAGSRSREARSHRPTTYN